MNAHEGLRALVGGALVVGMTAAAGQPAIPRPAGATLQVRSLAATCAACHGTDGHALQGEPMVALAGYPREALVVQMRAFRDGSRASTVMHQIATGYSDRQIDVLANYFAAQAAGRS